METIDHVVAIGIGIAIGAILFWVASYLSRKKAVRKDRIRRKREIQDISVPTATKYLNAGHELMMEIRERESK